MPTSGSVNYVQNTLGILTRAGRIAKQIGDGESPNSTQTTQWMHALNDLVKEWQADGMALWAVREYALPVVAGTFRYDIGVNYTLALPAPLKVIQYWNRTNATGADSPQTIITRNEYELLSNKSSLGYPTQLWYVPPGNATTGEAFGTVRLFPTPSADFANNYTVYFTGERPLEDFDATTDLLDFPSYWINAVTWGLADQIAYEGQVGLAERAMISKKAMEHKDTALSWGTEEGSFKIQPFTTPWESY